MVSKSQAQKISTIKQRKHTCKSWRNHQKKNMNGIISKYMDWYMPKIRHVQFFFSDLPMSQHDRFSQPQFCRGPQGHWHAFHPFDDHGGKHQPLRWPCLQIPQNLPCYDVTARSRWRKIPTQQKVYVAARGGSSLFISILKGIHPPFGRIQAPQGLRKLMRWICIDMIRFCHKFVLFVRGWFRYYSSVCLKYDKFVCIYIYI